MNGLPDVREFAEPTERQIRCLVPAGVPRSELQKLPSQAEVVAGDLLDRESLRDFFRDAEDGTLFHLAGLIHPRRRIQELYDVNVTGTRNLLEGAIGGGIRRIVAISSNSPVGCNPRKDHAFDERSPYNPYMHYGRSKMLMEELLCEAWSARSIETVILRPCWFYGPGQPARQTRFFRMVRAGRVPIVGDGESRRSMSYLDNTCQGLLLAESRPAARGKLYWIADRRPYSMNEIVGTIERLMETEVGLGVAHRRLRLPDVASEVAGAMDVVIQGLGLYHAEIHVLSEMNKTIACSIELAERELGYEPTVDLEEGMRRSIRWCVEQGQTI